MKPLNLDNSPCAPQSSNCVIWQGPNIPCIKLCTGDTISDVTYKLATELCTIMSELNLTNYDLSCLNLGTSQPTTFNELIQVLVTKICELENIPTSSTTPGTGGCPDCIITVAACFQVGSQTTMQLQDYITAVANRVCTIVSQITTINTQISGLNTRVTALENAVSPTPTVPSITTNCTLAVAGDPGNNVPVPILADNTYPINDILAALINDSDTGYCVLLAATGEPGSIVTAVTGQCVSGSSMSLANPANPMSTQYVGHWVASPVNIADAITNLWSSLCDVRTAYSTLNTNYNSLITALGTPTDVTAGKNSQCVLNTDLSFVTGLAMSTIAGWKSTPANLSDSYINAWLSICDTRTGLKNAITTLTADIADVASDLATLDGTVVALAATVADLPTAETVVAAGSGITVTGPVLTPGTPDLKTYTVALSPAAALGGMYTSGLPISILKVTPTASTNLLTNGTVQLPGTVAYDDINGITPTYNTGTGVWTCPTTGRYNISFGIHLSHVPGGVPTGFTSGSFIAGLIGATTTYYAINTQGLTQVTQYIDINGAAIGIPLTAGDTIALRVLNLSNVDYTATGSDKVYISIERIN